MKNYYNLLLALVFIFVSCSDDEAVKKDCIDQQLEAFDMVPYSGQKISCEFYLQLYVFKNKQYFQLGSYCADIDANPFDCDGNEICQAYDSYCKKFYENAIDMGIVGISQ